MNKLILASLSIASIAMADVSTITPYAGAIEYDSSTSSSLKDNAKFGGIYTSVGNLNYLFELAYSYTDIKYKNATLENLQQHDITMKYGKYYKNFTWNAGLHYINNNEKETYRDLGDGYVAIIGLDGYRWFGYDKLTYGVDVYYSRYADAHNDTSLTNTTAIDLWQFTPQIIYSKAININTKNTIALKANFIQANDYKDSSYTSYEIADTLGYKSFFTTLKFNGGEMKSGVKDGGLTVYNTKDLLKNAYSAKLGYYFTQKIEADISYTSNHYEEYDAAYLRLLPEGSSSIAVISMSYSY